MAEPLKTFFNARLVERLASALHAAHKPFPRETFVREARTGLEGHELLGRARHLSDAMHRELPRDYPSAVDVLVRSLGPELEQTEGSGMDVLYVAEHGLGTVDVRG
jgi:hypothetical protein